MKASENEYPKITVAESAAPGTPTADLGYIYEGTDKKLYLVDDTGAATDLTLGGDAIAETLIDAKGDVVVGTAANTAAILAIGTDDYVLTADSTAPLGLKWAAAAAGGLVDQGAFTYLDATEGAAPGTPASGYARIYAKTDGRIYSKDDGGVEYGPFDAAGGAGTPICVLQEIQAGSGDSETRTASFIVAPREGDHIIVITSCEGNKNVTSITLTNTTFAKLAESTASTAPHCEIWLGTVGASAGTSLKVDWLGSSYVNFLANEWMGLTGTLDQSNVVTNSASHNIPVITPTSASALVISGGANSTYNGDFDRYSGTVLNHCIAGHTANNYNNAAAFGFPGMVAISGSFPNSHGGTFSGVSLSIT